MSPVRIALLGLLLWPAWGMHAQAQPAAQADGPSAAPSDSASVAQSDGSSVTPSKSASEAQADGPSVAPSDSVYVAPAARSVAAPAAAPSRSRSTRRADRRAARSAGTWTGPRVELAYRVYSLRDDLGGRSVNSACFSGFLPTRKFRGGGGVEGGSRGYEYGGGEGLLSGNLFAGYQHVGGDLGRVVPYVVAIGELGVLFGKRFHTPMTRMLRGAGVELGADVNLVRGLYLGLGVGFMLYTIDDLAYDSWGLRLSIGL